MLAQAHSSGVPASQTSAPNFVPSWPAVLLPCPPLPTTETPGLTSASGTGEGGIAQQWVFQIMGEMKLSSAPNCSDPLLLNRTRSAQSSSPSQVAPGARPPRSQLCQPCACCCSGSALARVCRRPEPGHAGRWCGRRGGGARPQQQDPHRGLGSTVLRGLAAGALLPGKARYPESSCSRCSRGADGSLYHQLLRCA